MRQITNVLAAISNNRKETHAMLRAFTDSTGVEWRVWEVFPSKTSPLTSADEMSRTSLKATPFANGWLCFESASEKRRLAPIPSGWEFVPISDIESLLETATTVPARRPARLKNAV